MSVRVGEIGLQLQISTALVLTGATGGNLYVKRPGLVTATVDVSAEVIAAGAVTTFNYTTVATDPFTTAPGRVQLELEVDFGATKKLRSPVGILPVEESLANL